MWEPILAPVGLPSWSSNLPIRGVSQRLHSDLFSPTNEIFRTLLAILCILRMTSNPNKRYMQLFLNKLRDHRLHRHSGSDIEQADGNSNRRAASQDTAKWQARERALSSESDAIDPE